MRLTLGLTGAIISRPNRGVDQQAQDRDCVHHVMLGIVRCGKTKI